MSDNLPQELIVEILSRLPPKTLVRFRCVCKSWRSLISSPDFISTHTRQHTNSSHNPRKLFRQFCHNKEHYSVYLDNNTFDLDSESPITYPFDGISYSYFRIVGCCNGLLCLYNDLFLGRNTVILWNPAIRRKLILPRPQERPDSAVVDVRYKIPRLCKNALGFGFATRMNDFKVVRISYVASESGGCSLPPMVEIYTVNGGAWREVDSSSPSPLHSLCIVGHFWSQVFVNGAVHWISFNALWRGRGGRVHSTIMSFDMNDEVFGEISLPECLTTEPPTNMNVNAVGELLSVFRFNRFDRTDRYVSVWVMKEYAVANSWCRLCNIDLVVWGRVLDVRNNVEILLERIGCGLTSYNPQKNEFNCLRTGLNMFHAKCSIRSLNVSTYRESLALLVEGDEICDSSVRVAGRQLLEYYHAYYEARSQKTAQQFYELCASRIR